MQNKRALAIAGIVVFIAVSVAGCYAFFSWLIKDDMTPPELPTESSPGKLTITSNGCCFVVTDVVVSLVGSNGQRTIIADHEKVTEHDIFSHDIPNIAGSPLSLEVGFTTYYGEEAGFLMPVLQVEHIEDITQYGVLLYFQEADGMYFNIIVGDNHISIKRVYEENPWEVTDIPSTVYLR